MKRLFTTLLFLLPVIVGAEPWMFQPGLDTAGVAYWEQDARFAGAFGPDARVQLALEGGVTEGPRLLVQGGFDAQGDTRAGVVIYRGSWGFYTGLGLAWVMALPFPGWEAGLEGRWEIGYHRYWLTPYEFLLMGWDAGVRAAWKPWEDLGLVFTGKVLWETRVDNWLQSHTGPSVWLGAGWRIGG